MYNQNVMGDRVIYSQEELTFNFRIIMLLDKEYEPDEEKRIDKAFRHMGRIPMTKHALIVMFEAVWMSCMRN